MIRVSICKGSECRARGADALATEAGSLCASLPDVVVTRGGCWGLCNLGANIVVRQGKAAEAIALDFFGSDATFAGKVGETCYGASTVETLRRVVAEHVSTGSPIRDLALTAEQRKTAVKLSK